MACAAVIVFVAKQQAGWVVLKAVEACMRKSTSELLRPERRSLWLVQLSLHCLCRKTEKKFIACTATCHFKVDRFSPTALQDRTGVLTSYWYGRVFHAALCEWLACFKIREGIYV